MLVMGESVEITLIVEEFFPFVFNKKSSRGIQLQLVDVGVAGSFDEFGLE
jgi:hypothetical protein